MLRFFSNVSSATTVYFGVKGNEKDSKSNYGQQGHSFKDVRANCLCATFLSIPSKGCMRVRELRARKICHAKVCKQIWRPLRKVKKEIKVGN